MNFGKLYTDLTHATKPETQEEKHQRLEEEQRVAHLFQVAEGDKYKWQENPITKKYFLGLERQRDELLIRAIDLAAAYHIHNNHQQIVSLLTQVSTINTQLNIHLYGRSN